VAHVEHWTYKWMPHCPINIPLIKGYMSMFQCFNGRRAFIIIWYYAVVCVMYVLKSLYGQNTRSTSVCWNDTEKYKLSYQLICLSFVERCLGISDPFFRSLNCLNNKRYVKTTKINLYSICFFTTCFTFKIKQSYSINAHTMNKY